MIKIIITYMLIIICFGLTCHSSCNDCVQNLYTLCIDCYQNKTLTPVNVNFTEITTGLCIADVPSGTNTLGIFLLIVCIVVCIITRSYQAMYIFYTLQNLALISFLEVAWVYPNNYLFQALQYLLIFNNMVAGIKQPDNQLNSYNYYRLNQYYKSTSFGKNIIVIGIFNILIIVFLIIGLCIFWKIRKDQQRQQSIQPEQNQQSQQQSLWVMLRRTWFTDEVLKNIYILLTVIFFMMIEQTVLTIYTSAKFGGIYHVMEKPSLIVVTIFYLLFVLGVSVALFFYPFPFFSTKAAQYLNIWKKLAFPIFVIIPINYHFLLIILMLVVFIIESFFDSKGQKFTLYSRWFFYKLGQLVILILVLGYYLNEYVGNGLESTMIARGFLSLGLVLAIISILIQSPFGIYQAFFQKPQGSQNVFNSNRIQNQSQLKQKSSFGNKAVFQITQQAIADDLNGQNFRRKTTYEDQYANNIANENNKSNGSQNGNKYKIHNQFDNAIVEKKIQKNVQIVQLDDQEDQSGIDKKMIEKKNEDKNINYTNVYDLGSQMHLKQPIKQESIPIKEPTKQESKEQNEQNENKKKKKNFKDNIDKQLRLRYGIK